MIRCTKIVEASEENAPVVLACLPAGASKNHYRTIWPEVEQSIRVVELPPARDFVPDISSSMAQVAEFLDISFPDLQRFTIFGHSLGGSIALAMSQYLEWSRDTETRIVLSAVPSPSSSMLNSRAASEFIQKTLSEFLPSQFEVPHSFFNFIGKLVDQDFEAAALLSEFGMNSTGRVVGFMCGNSDPMCRVEDIQWWKGVSPSLMIRQFDGGHFGYMNPRVAKEYRDFVQRIASS